MLFVKLNIQRFADGTIVIGTEVDDSGLEKGIKKIESENDVNLKANVDDKELKKAETMLKQWQKNKAEAELSNDNEKISKAQWQIEYWAEEVKKAGGVVTEENQVIEKSTQAIQEKTEAIKEQTTAIKEQSQVLQEQQTESLTDKIKQPEIDLKTDKQSKGMKAISNFATKLASKFTGISVSALKFAGTLTKIVGGIGLATTLLAGMALSGIGLAGAFDKVLEKDKELKAQIEGIKTALTNAFIPIAERIVNAIKTIIYYVAYLAKAWFGVNIFAKDNEKAMNKAVGSAKKLSKQLAGFDEMNVLSDTSTSGASAGEAEFELKAPEDIEPPAWLVWIADNKDLILGVLAGIALGLLAIKLADPTTWIVVAIGAIAGLIAFIVSNWELIKGVLATIGQWVYDNVIKPVVDIFVWLWDRIVEIITPIIEFFKSIFTTVWENITITINNIAQIFLFLWNKIKEIFSPVIEWFKDKFNQAKEAIQKVFSPIVDFFGKLWDKVKNKLKAFGTKVGEVIGGAFKAVFNGIMQRIETFLNTPIKAINGLIDVINAVPGINLGRLSEFNLPRLERGGIVHNPGSGVMMGNYIAGEGRSPEAVIPLDDTTMDRLGSSIARHMQIDNRIYLNARQIARQMNITNSENGFATNS
jgi:hypothetical protein